MKKILPILIASLFLASFAKLAFAAELALEKIGTVDVTGKTFTSWSYYGLNPVFTGVANPSDSVIVSVDGVETATTADTTGVWTATPTGLDTYGIYEVEVSTTVDNILFTLTLASSEESAGAETKGGASDSTTSGATSLPQSGFSDLFIFAGLGTLFVGAAVASRYVFSTYE